MAYRVLLHQLMTLGVCKKNGENIPVKTEGTGSQIYIPKENQAIKGSITVPKQKVLPIYPNNQK